MNVGSLFRVVDASSLEATVLSEAEKRAQNSTTVPTFGVTDSLGFDASSLRNFCRTADDIVLSMAVEATRQEGQKLRERGVTSLVARDRVQMKEQILRGLLRLRKEQEAGNSPRLKATSTSRTSTSPAGFADESSLSFDDHLDSREKLIKVGAVTPLDDIGDDLPSGVPARSRMTLMDHKIAAGMKVRLPRSRHSQFITKRREAESCDRVRAQDRKGKDSEFVSRGKDDEKQDRRISCSRDIQKTNASSVGSTADEQGKREDSGSFSDKKSDTEETLENGSGWICETGNLRCVEDAEACLACRKRRLRTVNNPAKDPRTDDNGVDSMERKFEHDTDGVKAGFVTCPVCTSGVRVEDTTHPDASLSRHMDRCSRRQIARGERGQVGREGARGASDGQYKRRKTNRRPKLECRSDSGAGNKKPVSLKQTVGASVDEVNFELKAVGGGRLLVDDYSDVDFESRKEQSLHAAVADGESDNSPPPSIFDFGDGLKMNGSTTQKLFQFQVTGVRWMWQLHRQGAGGIVGDEMGLGKTVQKFALFSTIRKSTDETRRLSLLMFIKPKISAFVGALYDSNVMQRALVVCPATVLSHWMSELHKWAPQLRVIVLHRCAQAFNATNGSSGKIRSLIRGVVGWSNVVVITSYEGLKSLKADLLPCDWDYGILDEGQRIRNPDAEITLICKQIRTVHRLVLTGTPIQNNLRELWSLFDFVFPGRLGTLPAFEAEFSSPIRVGGYANASPMQARLAYRCALVLRDLIHPYLLRRQKKDLQEIIRLPAKTEQVLFCRLTSYQRQLYREFLESPEVKNVLRRTTRAFRAIAILRKICNHPDLVCNVGDSVVTRLAQNVWDGTSDQSEHDAEEVTEESKYGAAERSGKLLVLQQILPLWHKQGHRVLLFSQTRRMLNIVESFVKEMGLVHGRLDGNTPVNARQTLIDRFNNDESIFVMLLTTRTGGVGINLTGADRVILFDPDWNPSTDMQARERSWRVGQVRQVTVYRLITAGTIEEKIYHRQIFKTALTNRVLQDPKQKRIFSADELGDLFTLGDDGSLDGFTDTVDLFQGEGKIEVPDRGQRSNSNSPHDTHDRSLRKRARKRSQQPRLHSRETAPLEDETSSAPSALIATATVSLESSSTPLVGSSAETTKEQDVTNMTSSDKSKNDDSAVLQALYDSAPLSSVFHHDLAEGSGVSTVEQKRMEEAAKRAAQRALNQLRMSRRTLRAGAGQGGFQSSWTGRNGGHGASSTDNSSLGRRDGNGVDASQTGISRRFGAVINPGSISSGPSSSSDREAGSSTQSRSFFDRKEGGLVSESGTSAGISSQDILHQIRSRNRSQPGHSSSAGLLPELQASNSDSGSPEDKDAHYASLLERLQDFLAEASSGVDTAALIHAFGDVRPADVSVFRQLLQAIAVCNNGEWTLR